MMLRNIVFGVSRDHETGWALSRSRIETGLAVSHAKPMPRPTPTVSMPTPRPTLNNATNITAKEDGLLFYDTTQLCELVR